MSDYVIDRKTAVDALLACEIDGLDKSTIKALLKRTDLFKAIISVSINEDVVPVELFVDLASVVGFTVANSLLSADGLNKLMTLGYLIGE